MDKFKASDGVSIAWEQWGDAGSDPPVLLCHGYGINSEINWVAPGVVAALVAADRRVVAVHTRGHGQSEKPDDSSLYGEARMALDVSELADSLGLTHFDLVGYSMGSVIALIAASGDKRVRRLVVGGIGESVVSLGGVDTRIVPGDVIVDALLTEDPSAIQHPGARGIRTFVDVTGGDRLALVAQARVFHAEPIALDKITMPTLVMVGNQDELVQHPEVLVGALPDARLEIKIGDHGSVVGDPTFTPTLVAFLQA